MELTVQSLSAGGEKVEMRMVALGGGMTESIIYLMEMSENEDGDLKVDFILSNGPDVESDAEMLAQHIEMVEGMLETLREAAERV
jgi:hypothetical protein